MNSIYGKFVLRRRSHILSNCDVNSTKKSYLN